MLAQSKTLALESQFDDKHCGQQRAESQLQEYRSFIEGVHNRRNVPVMTSNPAQPRPPPPPPSIVTNWSRQRSFNTVPTLSSFRRASVPALSSQGGNQDVLTASDHELRPNKRRKVESTVASPENIAPALGALDEAKRDAGKYAYAKWKGTSAGCEQKPNSTVFPGDEPVLLPRLPHAASHVLDPSSSRLRSSCRYRTIVKVPNTPDLLQCPGDAPRLEYNKSADYYPWTGKHPEDVINETNVKSGYWDRAPQPADRESNTAKAPLYNAFKHRHGLDSLSALFSLVLDQKSKHGVLTSMSAFRPPPRVTLTEAKRRTWIADLADGGIPLRKLSRTIPQGIRGTALLELCLSNLIPFNRAIWFIKCVGANEIRTLRRKGASASANVGAESKWLKEWTASIGTFLGTVIEHSSTEHWSSASRYAFQLASRLYREDLLDRDQFLDWTIKSLSSCKLQHLLPWAAIAELYRQDLIRFRKRARQLVGALLCRMCEFQALNLVKNAVWERLRTIVRGLACVRPASFLMPEQWAEFSDILSICMRSDDPRDQRIYNHIRVRNERLMGRAVHGEKNVDVDKAVFAYLDSLVPPYDISHIDNCLGSITNDRTQLSKLCLRWATTRFRVGKARVYLIIRLLRTWVHIDPSLTQALLAFFTAKQNVSLLNLDNYRHVFAELARTRAISKSHFLQDVSIKGIASSSPLLRDLWFTSDELHLMHLRNNLLKKLEKDPATTLEDSQEDIASFLELFAEDTPHAAPEKASFRCATIKSLSWSSRFDLSQALKNDASDLLESADCATPEKFLQSDANEQYASRFAKIRNVLEVTGDIAALADVLHLLSSSRQELVWMSIVDTMHKNAECLSAIGAFESLQKASNRAYMTLRAMRPSILNLTTSMLDLAQNLPWSMLPVKALQQDLVRGDRGRALAACSPFSDGVAESLQQAGVTFIDDFEAILQGEHNMNEQTMTSLFTVLTNRIEKYDGDDVEELATLCRLMARLRLLHPVQADQLLQTWIQKTFSGTLPHTAPRIICELLYNRCLCVNDVYVTATPTSTLRRILRDLVTGCQDKEITGINSHRSYVVSLAVTKFMSTHAEAVLELILEESTISAMANHPEAVCAALTRLILETASATNSNRVLKPYICDLLDRFLGSNEQQLETPNEVLFQIDYLSLPFYRARAANSSWTDESPPCDEDIQRDSQLVFDGLRLSLQDDEDHCMASEVLSTFHPVVQDHVRTMAERQFVGTLPKLLQGKVIGLGQQMSTVDRKQSQVALRKLASLGPARGSQPLSECNATLIERLTMVAKLLGPYAENSSSHGNSLNSIASPSSPSYQALQTALPAPRWDSRYRDTIMWILEYLNMFLVVVSMNATGFSCSETTVLSKTQQNEQIKLVAILASVATQPALTQLLRSGLEDFSKTIIRNTINFTLDVAARLIDDLHEDGRLICTKIMKDRLGDDRIMWLLGNMASYENVRNPAGNGLVAVHETKGFANDFRPRQWEMVEGSGSTGKDNDACLALGLFSTKRI